MAPASLAAARSRGRRLEIPAGRGGSHFSLLFYSVPVGPGASRLVAGYSTNAVPSGVRALMASGLVARLLRGLQWAGDLGAHEVIDGDTLFLYEQVSRAGRFEGLCSE